MKGRLNKYKITFEFIKTYRTTHGIPPSTRQISEKIGLSPASVYRHLAILEALGWIHSERTPKGYRRKQTYRPIKGDIYE
jgi:DNA-binding MarR family transcriptional regulator